MMDNIWILNEMVFLHFHGKTLANELLSVKINEIELHPAMWQLLREFFELLTG
jgi:hypothetical protein